MDKKALLKVFKINNIAIGIIVTIIALLMFIYGDTAAIKGMSIGLLLGIWLGILINHFIKIPKVFGKKDEREIMLTIIAVSTGVGIAFTFTLITLSLLVFGAITLSFVTYYYVIIAIVIMAVVSRFITYKLLNTYL